MEIVVGEREYLRYEGETKACSPLTGMESLLFTCSRP